MNTPFKSMLLAAFSLLGTLTTFSQSIDPVPLLAGAQSDINYLGGNYLEPVGIALGNGLNNSWYSTAAVHSRGGFHINIAPAVVFVPDEATSFVIDEDQLVELELVGANNVSPTAFGENEEGPRLRGKGLSSIASFNMPAGVGFAYLPLANINLGVGIGVGTEVQARFFPRSGISGLEGAQIGMFGFGAVHDVSRWFTDPKEPAFHLSLQAGFTRLNFSQDIEETNGGQDQELVMQADGITVRVLISKELGFFTLYGAVGYNNASSDINLNGQYTYQSLTGPVTVEDPLAISVDANSLLFNIGGRIKIAKAISIFADYTFADYSSASLGLGVDLNFE